MKLLNLILLIAAVLLGACSKNSAKINGRFIGCNQGEAVYLEKILPGVVAMADSAKIDRKGEFSFNVKLENGQPTIYNLRYNNHIVTLLASPGETITVSSMCNIASNYEVEGSEESERIRELKLLLNGGAARLDSIAKAFPAADMQQRREAFRIYQTERLNIMKEHIVFLVSRPGMLSSLYALYQRLPNERYIANEKSDIIYYRMIADSVGARYPDSPYVNALKREIDALDTQYNMINLLNESSMKNPLNFPELNIKDMYGNSQRLSSLKGKVILLDFWISTSSECRANNAELKKLYAETESEGFAVYQVSLDVQKAEWITAVQNQKLPWVSVCDFYGGLSSALTIYNVREIPANFLIDRDGNIVGKNIYGDDLTQRVGQLLNKH